MPILYDEDVGFVFIFIIIIIIDGPAASQSQRIRLGFADQAAGFGRCAYQFARGQKARSRYGRVGASNARSFCLFGLNFFQI